MAWLMDKQRPITDAGYGSLDWEPGQVGIYKDVSLHRINNEQQAYVT